MVAGLIGARSPFLRNWRTGAALLAGPVATMTFLRIGDAYVIPRYLSYLLAPLCIVLASGAAAMLQRMGRQRPLLGPIVCLVVMGLLAARFVTLAPDVVGLPREANCDAADAIPARTARNARPPIPAEPGEF